MKQLGNLAIVCAQRPEVLMQIHGGIVTVHVGCGPERASLHTAWDDDAGVCLGILVCLQWVCGRESGGMI